MFDFNNLGRNSSNASAHVNVCLWKLKKNKRIWTKGTVAKRQLHPTPALSHQVVYHLLYRLWRGLFTSWVCKWVNDCVCVGRRECLSLYIMCLWKCVYERQWGYCTFSLTVRARAKLNCRGTSQSAAFFPFSSPTKTKKKKHGGSVLRRSLRNYWWTISLQRMTLGSWLIITAQKNQLYSVKYAYTWVKSVKKKCDWSK